MQPVCVHGSLLPYPHPFAVGLSCEAAPDECVVVLLGQIMTLTMVVESFIINAAAAFLPLMIEVTCHLALLQCSLGVVDNV